MSDKKVVTTTINNLIPLIKEAFENDQEVSIKFKGTSMSPFFLDNETSVTLVPFEGDLQKYKVYLYCVDETYLLHRYIKTKEEKHYFRGDALYNFEVVDNKDVLAVVKEMKYKGQVIPCHNFSYRNSVKYYLFKKSIKLLIRRIIKGK